MTDRCYFCGENIPEGRQVCPSCEADAGEPNLIDRLFPVQPGQEDPLIHALERVEDAIYTSIAALGFVAWCVFCFLMAVMK